MKEFVIEIMNNKEKLTVGARMVQLKPTTMLVYPNGADDDSMSLAFVLSTARDPVVVAQISTKMLTDAMPHGLLYHFYKSLHTEVKARGIL